MTHNYRHWISFITQHLSFQKVQQGLQRNLPTSPPSVFAMLLMLAWGLLFSILWATVIYQDANGIHTSSANLWSDWVVHMTYTNIFHDWPLSQWLERNPLFSIGNFRYPPVPNFFSATLMTLGFSTVGAMQVSSLLMCLLLLAALYLFFRAFKLSPAWSAVGSSLFLLNGGLGFFYYMFGDAESATHLGSEGIVIQNFIISEFIPQRSIQFAAPLFVASLILIKKSLETVDFHLQRNYMLTAGALSNFILLSSMHTYLSLISICVVVGLCTLKHWRQWLLLVTAAGISNGFFYFAYYGANETQGFLKFAPGELINYSKLSILDHFVKNYGFILPLAAYAFYKFELWKAPFLVAGAILFSLVYLMQFQPWIWDNTKILTWAYLIVLVPALILLKSWWDKNLAKQIVTVGLIIISVASGAIDVWNVVKPNNNTYTMFTAEDLRVAEEFKTKSSPDDLVLTHMGPNNWVHSLASRQVFKGYGGWLWSYGIDLSRIDNEGQQMLNGNLNLLRSNNIKYVVIDRHHEPSKVNFSASKAVTPFIASRRYRIYKID